MNIGLQRLQNQAVIQPETNTVEGIVSGLLALQAQDYTGTLWSIGLRMKQPSLTAVEKAIADRVIVRTWPMRGTLHFVAANDIKWLVNLLGPRMERATAGRRRQLELDDVTLERAKAVLIAALENHACLTRRQVCAELDKNGIATAGQRGIHILRYYSEKALLCYGPHKAKEPTFVLLAEWLPKARTLEREEALAELARRYFTGHGPATLQDLAGWAYLPMADVKLAIALAKTDLEEIVIDYKTYYLARNYKPDDASEAVTCLLPGFDEYLLGYKDRSAVLQSTHNDKIVPGGNGMFLPTIIINGQVVGTWKKQLKARQANISLQPFKALSSTQLVLLQAQAGRYGDFVSLPVQLIT